jgi:dihydrodipicolinate synthase/N-acetylneuraminate lyase
VTRLQLSHTWRLGPVTTALIQPAFYADLPFDSVRPYLLEGLDLFVGSEPLVLEGLEAGAVGAVSGLATAWPQIVASLVHDRSAEAGRRVIALRSGLAGVPFHAALKHVLVDAGVLGTPDVQRRSVG